MEKANSRTRICMDWRFWKHGSSDLDYECPCSELFQGWASKSCNLRARAGLWELVISNIDGLDQLVAKLPFSFTAKLILIDPLREYSVQPLCLCWCLYKQPLPNLELAYFSNMCDFREADMNTSLYLMSAPMCRHFQWPWYSKTRKKGSST